MRSETQKLAEKNAKANRMQRELYKQIGSPYRIAEAIRNKGIPIPNGGAKMVSANWTVTAVELTCPHCQSTIEAPNGSLFWTITELGVRRELGKHALTCECGKSVRIPSRIPGLGGGAR
jgi:hypothetical protein